jgi:two-component system C4-dicarboxylate transport sensor histidine kinase DctB
VIKNATSHFTIRCDSGLPPVQGSFQRLEQVIINLLRNAIDATRGLAAPEIEILLSAGETATLAVRDNGHGIENLETLFEPFYTTKKPGEGVGLGLAISSGIVNDMGGRLTARNGETGGAVFEVQLPILGAGRPLTEEPNSSDRVASPSGTTTQAAE